MNRRSWLAVAIVIVVVMAAFAIFGHHSHTVVIVNGQELHGWEKLAAGLGGGLFTALFALIGIAFLALLFIGASMVLVGTMALALCSVALLVAPSILPWLLGVMLLVWVARKAKR